jgi:hypothetical protein
MVLKSRYSSISIPTKTYLKKYLHFKLGETFFASGPHHIQKYLTNLLEKKIYRYKFTALNTQYNDNLVIFLSKSTFCKIGFGLKRENVLEFNNYLEELFDEDLYKYCQDYLKFHRVARETVMKMSTELNIPLTARQRNTLVKYPTLDEARSSFAKKLQLLIEEDITDENLKRMEYRARKRREKRETNFSQPVLTVQNTIVTLLF